MIVFDDDKKYNLTVREFNALKNKIDLNWIGLREIRRDTDRQLDDLKWRITMLEHKLESSEPIIGEVPLGDGSVFFTKNKTFVNSKKQK